MISLSCRLIDGEYEKDSQGKLIKAEYTDALLQKALLLIEAKRGRFYPDKDFGSRIDEINIEPFEEYALSYIRQALDGLDGTFVTEAKKDSEALKIRLIINDEEKEVILPLD